MGRGGGKVTLKEIQNEKLRKSSFIQRNKGLAKKVCQFSKNFGVEACLIVYDGDGDGKPMIWPQDSTIMRSMLTKYEQQKNETTLKKFDVKDYFANKKNIVEAEILSVRKKITMNKYPTWSRCFNNLEREQLKSFTDIVDFKIQACNQRINMLKNTQESDQTSVMEKIAQMPDNVVSPQASQPDDTMKPLININEMKDLTDLIEWDNLMPQNNVFSSHSSELDVMHSIPQMQPIPSQSLDNISLPPVSSTKQFGEYVKLDDLTDKSDQEWAIGEFLKLDELTDKSDQEWATQLMDLDDWAANKIDDGDGDGFVNWVRQPEWQDNSFLSEIEQECAALNVFSQTTYGF